VTRPDGIAELAGVAGAAKPNATLTMPAAWVRDLLAYVEALERVAASRVSAATRPET
jgi:hypothetical protein